MLEFDESEFARTEQAFARTFRRESWSLYGFTIFIIVLRFVARIRRFGFHGLKIDDALMVFATATLTGMTYGINKVLERGGETAYLPPQAEQFTSLADLETRILNAKWIFAIEHLTVATLWSAKFCMLVIYLRLTDGLQARRGLVAVTIYVALTYIGSELSLLFSCFPIDSRWTIGADSNCSFYNHYQIVECALSLSSSALILITGLPVVIQVRLPPRQKWVVTLLFGLGIFDVAADAVRKVYVTQVKLYGFMFYKWYMLETTVALLVCNLPFIWYLMSEAFPGLREWVSKNELDSTPRFWGERNRKGSYFCCVGSRKESDQILPSYVTPLERRGCDGKCSNTTQEKPMDHRATFARRLSQKMEAAIVNRMVGGELEDEIGMDVMPNGNSYLDIERAVSMAKTNSVLPSIPGEEVTRMDSATSPPISGSNEGQAELTLHCRCCATPTLGKSQE